ncbi:hypothetical protein JRQ81_004946 [Phrynocephalus forsythii]|uniref:Uncharacterized protein n=1 Tax=Phrynocephalus forsythii TaxID=171643 RepID=A0A9Q0XJ45_9SAUR|nr:hypothetical protein JRQ81_004946 [Phrynocephalus forsythii]
MEIPTITIGSKTETEIVQDEDVTLENSNQQTEDNKPQELSENTEESSRSQELNEQAEVSRSLDQDVQAEEGKSQGPEEHVEDAKPEELAEESSEIPELDEASEDNQLQEPGHQVGEKASEDNQLQEPGHQVGEKASEDNQLQESGHQVGEKAQQELNEQPEDNKPQDLKDWAEEQMKMLEEQQLDEELTLSSLPDSEYIGMTEWQDELLGSSAPESRIQDYSSPLQEQIGDSTPQALKEDTEERVDTSQYKSEKEPSLYSATESRKKSIKKQKDEACNTDQRKYLYIKPVTKRNLGKPPLQGGLSQRLKPKTADKAIQCNKLLMRRLPLPGTVPPQRNVISRVSSPAACEDKATQISQSFERLHKRPPPLVLKKKNEDKTLAQVSPSKTSPSNLSKGNGHMNKGHGILRKSSGSIRKRSESLNQGSGSHLPSTVVQSSSPIVKKGKSKGPNVVYNLYLNFHNGCKGIGREHHMGTSWAESVEYLGLSRACTVFSILKSGRIHVSKLRPTLDILGILVTSEEMYHTLNFVSVNESCTLDFTEFLEVVNKTSPFAETDALQNTLRAFRKINNGMVTLDDLSSVLRDLEVHLSSEEIHTTLGHTRLSKNKKIDLSEFLLAARDLKRSLEEEEEVLQNEYTSLRKKPFQDVAELVNAESRWRRKYQSYFDEDIVTSTSLSPWLALTDSHDYICPAYAQKTVCLKSDLQNSNTACTELNAEGEAKGDTTLGEKKSESDTRVRESHSLTSPVGATEGEDGNHEITKVSKSHSDVTDGTDPSTLPSEPSAERKHKNHDNVEAPESQSDLRLSNDNQLPAEDNSIST